ncbi:Major facilitator superfamily domain containing protein [Naviculisporaceae sp. PSN 640]
MPISNILPRLFHESGLKSVYTTGLDAWLIILNRCCRMLAYGGTSLVLALFFAELQIPDSRIGLFMSLTLLGDVILSLLLTLIADRVGRRRTLFAGSGLMILSGVIFATCENYWALLFAAVVGVISATGGDFGPFRAIEESTIAELTCRDTRNDVLVWYVTTASIGSAVGTELAGRIIGWLTEDENGKGAGGWTLLEAYHAIFWLYALMGALNMVSTLFLSEKCELLGGNNSTAPLLTNTAANPGEDDLAKPAQPEQPASSGSFLSNFKIISHDTFRIIVFLWVLLMIDSLADGMTSSSLTTYFISTKFPELPKSRLGDMISLSYLICSLSSPFAGPLARHIGLINTMVFTHIPSSAAVLFFPFPSTAAGTFALLLLRMGLNNMDQAPRAALISAVVRPQERTAVMGITSLLRTLSGSLGPSITGFLAGAGRFGIAFVVAGALRLVYDCGLWAIFINVRLHRHEEAQDQNAQAVEAENAEPQAV